MAKKSLGQNFLISAPIIREVVQSAKLIPDDFVIEIGPGKGALTKRILDAGARILAIEKDRELIPILEEKFNQEIANNKLILREDDILMFDYKNYFLDHNIKNYKIVANIPYYITGILLRTFLESSHQPISMTLLVQKEVAERIVCRDNKESLLSLSVKAFASAHYIRKVPPKAFRPAPAIDSAIIHIDNISHDKFYDKKHPSAFFTLIKIAFAHKRKTFLSNVRGLYEKEKIEAIMKKLDLDSKIRPEDISFEQWLLLSRDL